MARKFSLLLGAGLGAVVLGCSAVPAAAKPIKHRAKTAHVAHNSEVEELKAQVQALTARLDAQDAAQRDAAAQLQAAQAAAAAAQQQAAAAQAAAESQAKALPDEVKTQMASWKPKGGWWDDTTISGRAYFNISSIDQKTNGVKSTSNGFGYNIKRFYFGVDHKFSDVFSANLTTDISNVVGQTSNANFNSAATPGLVGRGLYIKKAYLQAKINPALIIRVGSADLPWVPYAEGIYGYRHIENTLIDRISFGTSADWGVHVLGDIADGLFSYQISVVDGGGYRNVKVTKTVDVEGRASLNYKGIQAAVGGYVGTLGNDVNGTTTFNTAKRFNALLAYKTKLFTIGGEYFYAKDFNNNGVNYITTNTEDKADGFSAFGSLNFAPKWSAFGRYDWIKPRKDTLPTLKDQYFNVGVQFSPAKIVDLALVYKRDKAKNGTIATSNGTIGGSVDGTYDEVGLFGQFRF